MTDSSDPKRRRIIIAADQDEDDFGLDGGGSETERYERVNDRVSDEDSEVDSNPDALLQDDEEVNTLSLALRLLSISSMIIYCCVFLLIIQQPEDEEGEDLAEHWLEDYEAAPELDTYDEKDLDLEEYAPMTYEQRLAADLEMARRDATVCYHIS
jgi:hypothetical protein